MAYLKEFLDIVLHLDKSLDSIITNYGVWTYLILLVIIFCETGLVVTPFLPGDSLLFAAGAFAAKGSLSLPIVLAIMAAAAIVGDAVNYAIGYYLGPTLHEKGRLPFIKQKYLDRTHKFYEKYGKKTIILARFVPIVRTFAPFLAGVGSMRYTVFALFNITGGILWVLSLVFIGYFFGNLTFVKNNFTNVIYAIVVISVMPVVIEFWRHRKDPAAQPPNATAGVEPAGGR
jgi:membrane-associated protein